MITRTELVQVTMLATTTAASTMRAMMIVMVVVAAMKTPAGQCKYNHDLNYLSWCDQ